MKKFLVTLLLLIVCIILLVGCNIPSNNDEIPPANYHTHQWSNEVCGEKQKCQLCYVEKEIIVSHTTDNGICERCGQYYISKDNAIANENARHQQTLQNIEEEYNTSYEKFNLKANEYKSHIIHSETYITSRLSEIANRLSILRTELALLQSDTSLSGKNQAQKIQLEINNLEKEQTNLIIEKNYWSKYKSIQESTNSLKSTYKNKLEQENKLHEENIDKINAQT